MLNFMQPTFFMPIKGIPLAGSTRDFSRRSGIPAENIFLTKARNVLTYQDGRFHLGDR